MRILYFADIRFPLERANGIQTMETCYALGERGHDVRLIVRPDTQTPPRDPFAYYGLSPSDRVTIERAPVSGPHVAKRFGYLSFALGRSFGKRRADILMTRDLGTASIFIHVPRTLRAPVVYESHGYSPDVAAALPRMLTGAQTPSAGHLKRLAGREARVWAGADGYVTITAGLRGTLENKYGTRARAVVVPDGVRVGYEREWQAPAPGDPTVVGYAGHLYPWKGVDVLIEAIARVPGVSALIVGGHEAEGDRVRLEALVERLGLDSRVTFTGHVEPGKVPALLGRATVLVLPNPASSVSMHSTSPLKLFEYMATGRAIVASDLPSFREVLRHGHNAWLVSPGNPEALARGIRRVAEDRQLADRLARQALVDVADYSWDRRAARLEALFHEVCAAQ